MKLLSEKFYELETINIAKKLLGKYLVYNSEFGRLIGRIIETEAYLQNDPASHSFNGLTKRNKPMFEDPGKAYVYFTYGMHHCFNVVTQKKGIGEAVLICALEPLEGIAIMQKNRKTTDVKNLCSGPAKLTQAFGITLNMNNWSLIKSQLRIMHNEKSTQQEIITTKRVGISKGKELKYRFLLS